MVSPFERIAQEEAAAAKLPVDNWRQRRIDDVHAHEPSITAVSTAIDRLGSLVLDGRISTNAVRRVKAVDFDTINPSEEIAEAIIGIRPTGAPRRWDGYSFFTPDAALAVGIHLKDNYDYHGTGRPRPLGQVGLTVYARSWGRITPDEKESIETVEGAEAEYGDNGYDRHGTRVTIWREAGQALDQSEVETMLAPLAGHVLRYFDIMNLADPKSKQPAGNFSNRNASPSTIRTVTSTHTNESSWQTQMLLGE